MRRGGTQYAGEQQRCQWHVARDLCHAMHQDGAGVGEARPAQRRLAGGPRAMEESRAAFAPCSTVVCGGELGVAGGFAQYAEE